MTRLSAPLENPNVFMSFPFLPAARLAVVVAASAAAFTAFAADPAKLENLRVTNACKYCDLTDAALSGADLRGADFQNANLAGANLSKADLSQRPMEKRTLSTNF